MKHELPPVIAIAKTDTLSIRKGQIYQWREYLRDHYDRYCEPLPRIPEGTLEGVGGGPPCCVCYPRTHLEFVEPPALFDWL